MTHVSGTASQTTPSSAAHPPSANGGPPGQTNGRQIAIILGAAFVVGVLLARWLDWRSHAHPHD